jgi:hypothetical protein
VPADESVLLVPLRSNASTLLTGAPIASFRRRLKFASIFFDRLLLEGGVLRMNAGPNLAFSVVEPFNQREPPRWQTPIERNAAGRTPFQLALGRETAPGVPAPTMHTVGVSETTISWVATLYPFADELLPVADWVEFVKSPNPTGDISALADRWTRTDQRSPALERAIPVGYVRDTVIKNVNRDLALGTAAGFTVTIDPFHQRVVAQRFSDDAGWNIRGFTVPILFPDIGGWQWEAVAELRRDRNMIAFRAMLREVEAEALAEAAGGDIERAAHRAYERFTEKSSPVERIAEPIKRTIGGLLISGAAGAAASPVAGIGGIVTSSAIGSAIGGVLDARAYIRRRRSQGWAAIVARIRAEDS